MRTTEQLSTRLKKVVRFLRRNYPVPIPVTVRVHAEMKGLCGLCLIDDDRALIRLTKDDDQIMCETLVEEWSHIIRHLVHVPIEKEHDMIFWAIYGDVIMKYRGGE